MFTTPRLSRDSLEESVAAEKELVIIKPGLLEGPELKYASLNLRESMLKASNDMQTVHLT